MENATGAQGCGWVLGTARPGTQRGSQGTPMGTWWHPTSAPKLAQALPPPQALWQGSPAQAALATSNLFPASFLGRWQAWQEQQGYGGVYGGTMGGAGSPDPTPKLLHGCKAKRVLHAWEWSGFGLTPWPRSRHSHHPQHQHWHQLEKPPVRGRQCRRGPLPVWVLLAGSEAASHRHRLSWPPRHGAQACRRWH